MDRRISRLVCAVMVAIFCAGTVTVVYASAGYNDNWAYCRGASPWDPFYWWYRCDLPEDPSLGHGN